MLDRDEAMALRKTVKEAIYKMVGNRSYSCTHAYMSHSHILAQYFTPTGCRIQDKNKFFILDINVQTPDTQQTSVFDEKTELLQPQICELAEFIRQQLGIELEFVDGVNKNSEAIRSVFVEQTKIELRYFTKNDATGWGRPHIILVIPFE